MDRPLVILNFQGVLGDFFKDKDLNLRHGVFDGLRLLCNHF
jgi:hypothetical protein